MLCKNENYNENTIVNPYEGRKIKSPEKFYRVPSIFLRANLFLPVARGKRLYVTNLAVNMFDSQTILYTGYRLYRRDMCLWMVCLDMFHKKEKGLYKICTLTDLCRLMGKSTQSGRNRQNLKESLERLLNCEVKIENRAGKLLETNLLDVDFNYSARKIKIEIPNLILKMFSAKHVLKTNIPKRLFLNLSPVEQYLLGFIFSQGNRETVFRYSFDKLTGLMGIRTIQTKSLAYQKIKNMIPVLNREFENRYNFELYRNRDHKIILNMIPVIK